MQKHEEDVPKLWHNTRAFDAMIIQRSWSEDPLFTNGWGQNIGLESHLVHIHDHEKDDYPDVLSYGENADGTTDFFQIEYYSDHLIIYYGEDGAHTSMSMQFEFNDPKSIDAVYERIKLFVKIREIEDLMTALRDSGSGVNPDDWTLVEDELDNMKKSLARAVSLVTTVERDIRQKKTSLDDEIPF